MFLLLKCWCVADRLDVEVMNFVRTVELQVEWWAWMLSRNFIRSAYCWNFKLIEKSRRRITPSDTYPSSLPTRQKTKVHIRDRKLSAWCFLLFNLSLLKLKCLDEMKTLASEQLKSLNKCLARVLQHPSMIVPLVETFDDRRVLLHCWELRSDFVVWRSCIQIRTMNWILIFVARLLCDECEVWGDFLWVVWVFWREWPLGWR